MLTAGPWTYLRHESEGTDLAIDAGTRAGSRGETSLPCSVSVIAPVRDAADLARVERWARCLDGGVPCEVVIVLTQSASLDLPIVAWDALPKATSVRVVRSSHGIEHYGSLCGDGAAGATSTALAFVHPDLSPATGWLRAAATIVTTCVDAGSVGGRIVGSTGEILHAGVAERRDGTVAVLGYGNPDSESKLHTVRRKVHRVSASLMVTTRALFEGVGGFDSRPVDDIFADDCGYSGRIRALGREVYFEPSFLAFHPFSTSEAALTDSEDTAQLELLSRDPTMFYGEAARGAAPLKIVRVLPGVLNEADILEENLRFYIDQGFETVVVENGSSDDSYAICERYVGKGILRLVRFESEVFLPRALLKLALTTARAFRPDWIVLADADEFIEPMEPGCTLREAITREHQRGFNLIAQSHFMFRPTEVDRPDEPRLLERVRHYGRADDFGRAKVWRDSSAIDLENPHHPEFLDPSDRRLSPTRLALRHYPLRSEAQAFAKRLRIRPTLEDPMGWSVQYLGANETLPVVHSSKDLTFYADDSAWSDERRIEEVRASVEDALAFYAREYGHTPAFKAKAMHWLSQHSWPRGDRNVAGLLLFADTFASLGDLDFATHLREIAAAEARRTLAALEATSAFRPSQDDSRQAKPLAAGGSPKSRKRRRR